MAAKETTTPEVIETPVKKIVTLFSRADYPIVLKYNNDLITIPPRGKAELLDESLLDLTNGLPAGVQSLTIN